MRITLFILIVFCLIGKAISQSVSPVNYGSADSVLYQGIIASTQSLIVQKFQPSSESYSRIVMETRANCPPCEDWIRVESFKTKQAGWTVEYEQASPNVSTPRFRICIGNRCWQRSGYLTQSQLQLIVAEHNRTQPATKQPTQRFALDSESLSADAQPTPWPGVSAMLNALSPKPNEVLIDYGCGYDARLLIQACRYFDTQKAIGVEIDPELAESARRYVEAAGLSDRIEIITGDSTKLDIPCDIGIAYLWPKTLTLLKPKLEKLNRFASYGFAVSGLNMTMLTASNGGQVYVWKRPSPAVAVALVTEVQRIPVTQTTQQIVQLPRGSYCQICGRNCRNPMAHKDVTTIVGYQDSAVVRVAQPTIIPLLPMRQP